MRVAKKLFILLAVLALFVSCGSKAKDGTYTATAPGHNGPVTVEVKINQAKIESVKVVADKETAGLRQWPLNIIPESIVKNQTTGVDVVTGASFTSRAIIAATEDCLKQSGADMKKFTAAVKPAAAKDETKTADVIIVGGGGAGLSAAIEAGKNGGSVIVIEKMGTLGGNSIMAGGIYNAPDKKKQQAVKMTPAIASLVETALAEKPISNKHAALQEAVRKEWNASKAAGNTYLYDSFNWFALQTWNGGDKRANLDLVQEMANKSFENLTWVESMGMEFRPDIMQGAGSMYQRTHAAVLPNGTGYFKAFIAQLQKMPNVEIIMNTEGKSLITEGDKITGVNAVAKDGSKITLKANKGVIIATGGFAGNVELRQKYAQGEKWPNLGPSVPTSNMPGVTGDGIFMAESIGAALVDMDQIQLLQVCNPQTGTTADHASGIGVDGYMLVNTDGKRFVREDGRRDEISKGIIAQPGGIAWLVHSGNAITNPEKQTTLGGTPVAEMVATGASGYIKADTVEQLAQLTGMPLETLKKTISDFNAHIGAANAKDEFGRVLYSVKSEGPWYAYKRAPAVHHTMGGIVIDTSARVLKADGSPIKGLYAAGEVTGGIHGGNRLGGNAIVDFVVFGRTAGNSAAAAK